MLIQHQLCSKLISPLSHCHICQDVCPQQALDFTGEQWQLTEDCTQCGLCTANCPQQVFQLDYPSLLQQANRQEKLLLACQHNQLAPQQSQSVHCLQQFSPLQLLMLSQQYAEVVIYLSQQDCEQCTKGWYSPLLALQLQQYHLQDSHIRLIQQQYPETDANEDSNGQRRKFFRQLARDSKKISGDFFTSTLNKWLDPFAAQEKMPGSSSILPMRLPLFTHYQQQVNSSPAGEDTELPFRQLSCQSCTLCGACAAICPTKALILRVEEKTKELLYRPEYCNQCNLCQDICFQHQLFWNSRLTIKQFLASPLQLSYSTEQICSQCNHAYYLDPPSSKQLCSFCQ